MDLYGSGMRWTQLFADLEAQVAAEEAAELAAEVADRSRYESGQIPLLDRLRSRVGADVTVAVRDSSQVSGSVGSVGADWLVLCAVARDILIPGRSLVWVRFAPYGGRPVGLASEAYGRLGLGHALRLLARDRAVVLVELAGFGSLTGTIDRVGADHFDLAEHAVDEPRRERAVHAVRVVAFAALLSVASRSRQRAGS